MRAEQSEKLFDKKIEYENIKHKDIMEEIQALSKTKITHFHRD